MNNIGKSMIVVLIVLIVLLGVMRFTDSRGISVPYLGWLERGIFNITGPIFDYFSKVYNWVSSFWYGIFNTGEILRQNDQLEKKVAALKRQILQLEEFKRENKRLKELLAFKIYVDEYKVKGARVIGYSPSSLKNIMMIDRGTNDGIREKMPVISYNGTLVGRISYTGSNTSQVQLVNDPEFVVGGIVQREESRAIGLVNGQPDKQDTAIMNKISWDADIKEGDLILTSGLSNNYPRGLPIGSVTKVETDNYGLSLKADINLFLGLKTIEEVLVITEF